jgi:hypothetical protein
MSSAALSYRKVSLSGEIVRCVRVYDNNDKKNNEEK